MLVNLSNSKLKWENYSLCIQYIKTIIYIEFRKKKSSVQSTSENTS